MNRINNLIQSSSGKNEFTNKMNDLTTKSNSNYGILISNNDKIIYEKYVGNNKDTRFRIFSCSKPINAMAIFLLAQDNKLKLTDTIDKFSINIPYNDKITINHLLNHSSRIYDFSFELYFNPNPKKMFNEILEKNETKFIFIVINIYYNSWYNYEQKNTDKKFYRMVGYEQEQRNQGIKGESCKECSARKICDGFSSQYAKRYGFAEAQPYIGELIDDPTFFIQKQLKLHYKR